MKNIEKIRECLLALGFDEVGEYEFRLNKWTIEYVGTDDDIDKWRIDDFESGGYQILFIALIDCEDVESIINLVRLS